MNDKSIEDKKIDRKWERCKKLDRWMNRFVFIYFGVGGAILAIAGIVLIILGVGGWI